MKRGKVPPSGAVFLVPLRDGGYCIGLLANASGDGHAFGYFFGPVVSKEADVNFAALMPENAVLVGMFGDLELIRGNWQVIGRIEPWDPSAWPMQPLARVDETSNRAWLSTYNNAFDCIREEEIDVKEAANYPADGMMGAGAVEIILTKLMEVPIPDC